MTVEAPPQVRPDPPLRVRTMFLPLLVATVGFVGGGFLGIYLSGVLWGVVASGALLLALRIGKIASTPITGGVLAVGVIASTVLSTFVMPDTPQSVDVALCVRFTLAWLPAGLAAGWFVRNMGRGASAAFNVAIGWLAGAALALPASVSFEVTKPLETLRRSQEAVFGGGDYATAALSIALIGVAALLGVAARLSLLTVISVLLFFTVYAGSQVGFTIPGLIRNVSNIVNVPNFWPPDFGWAVGNGDWWWFPSWEFGNPNRANPMVETLRISLIASTLGVGLALPLSFLASTLTAPNRPSYLIDKGFISLIRTVPDLFWAMIFVTSVGAGAFAGALALVFFSLAIMSKLLSETVDSADPGPLEAAKATGSRHFPAVRAAVLPQVLPNYVAYALYVFEINIRASVVLGVVGAGGIGQVLEAQRSFFRFDRVLAVVIMIFVLVFVIEQISIALRRRLV
ncbi:MAG: phosphonate ABC transporter, permease protein PhnE [Acidimicrobiia bacterium]